MIKWIRKQLDKIPSSPGLILSGQWRVVYSDGHVSRKMTYDVAKDYAKIFGGYVIYSRYENPNTYAR